MGEFFLGEIRMFPWDWAPKYWMQCNGALMSVQQNQALFSLLGVTYGGNGSQTFALPDLRGRVIVGVGQIAGGGFYPEGAMLGSENVTLVASQLPQHVHTVTGTSAIGDIATPLNNHISAAQTIPVGGVPVATYAGISASPVTLPGDSLTPAGNGQSHPNMQPYLVMNYCIALSGVYPSRS